MDVARLRRDDDPYDKIGVKAFINCCSVRTIHGGSLMLPEVKVAMAEASKRFVNLYELMERVGSRLSELTGAEFGFVTCGSAAAICLATAGAVAGNDPEKMLRLPNTDGMKNRVLMPRGQRFAYDHGIRMVGATIVEIGNPGELLSELDSGKVAMICVLGTNQASWCIDFGLIVKEAGARGVPVLVDAASGHMTKPDLWLSRGANMVAYSGGKFLRGPQATGLLLGDRDIVRAAWANASPHHALGRPMKVSKEDIVGLLTAVEVWYSQRDHQAEELKWRDELAIIAQGVSHVPGVRTKVLQPRIGRVRPLEISWDRTKVAQTGLGLRQALLGGDPRIMIDDAEATDYSVQIDPFGLQPGEAEVVGARIAEVLSSQLKPKIASNAAETPYKFSGRWELRIDFLNGGVTQQLILEQVGCGLTGVHRTKFAEGQIQGNVDGMRIEFQSLQAFEGTQLAYLFEGEVKEGQLSGTVKLGIAGKVAGPVNVGQFGSASWAATRC